MNNAKRNQRAFVVAAIVHATLVAAWWWAAIYADIDIPVGGRVWLPFALAWVLWPIYAAAKYRAARGIWAALIVGAVLIAPTVSTIYAFSVWSIGGFAP